ncbi:DUF2336 domain-containing protein [Microvirga tunisiensis]|uniref:DUF2336 domain-containing protein n=1 Tax=Pannonibacter tanglangensis TaxID=2750084 RepID=A0A7X5JAW4_9HYPH|nr:DUF2336 domain-containing protein [Pannonibacter sp. XCT-53]NBN79815.1 DUF2336 domain-containing protein [Pannonibacter sp. XCT-53]
MLYSLLALAQETTPEARSALMQKTAEVFLRGVGTHTPGELALFSDILLQLVDQTDDRSRAALSRALAGCAETPSPLALRLAADVFAVARPILERSKALGAQDIIELARRLDDEHLAALAGRQDLPSRAADALVRRGSSRVHRKVACNRHVHLSDWALRSLAERALKDAVLKEDLSTRKDLTPAICTFLIPHVSPATRERLQAVAQGTISAEELDGIARRRALRRALGIRLDTFDVPKLWRIVETEFATLDDLLILLLEDDRLGIAAELMSHGSRDNRQKLREAVLSGDVEHVIAAARRANLSQLTFEHLARARCRYLRIPEAQAEAVIRRYRPDGSSPLDDKRRASGFAARRSTGHRTARPA